MKIDEKILRELKTQNALRTGGWLGRLVLLSLFGSLFLLVLYVAAGGKLP
jgi:hypothetical protein